MGAKSRGNYQVNLCLRFNCLNRDIKCSSCLKYDEFIEMKTEETKEVRNENS